VYPRNAIHPIGVTNPRVSRRGSTNKVQARVSVLLL
jgi:hypothetical protein